MWNYIAKTAVGTAIPKIIDEVASWFKEEEPPIKRVTHKPKKVKKRYNGTPVNDSTVAFIMEDYAKWINGEYRKDIPSKNKLYEHFNSKYKLNKSVAAIRKLILKNL